MADQKTQTGAAPGQDPSILVIAGRQFHGVDQALPAAQDHYITGQLRLAGCLEIIADPREQFKSEEERSAAFLTQLFISGRACYVLAGCLTEVGTTWSIRQAAANAEAFNAATDQESKRVMRDALLGLVLGFFQYEIASVSTSLKSSLPN